MDVPQLDMRPVQVLAHLVADDQAMVHPHVDSPTVALHAVAEEDLKISHRVAISELLSSNQWRR